VPLVKAVQELQIQLEEQQKQIEELKTLIKRTTTQEATPITVFSSALLKQNTPNPFSKSSVISYYIPKNAGKAQIILTDMSGRTIKTFIVTNGEGQINIGTYALQAATYNYTLYIEGKKIDTKKMIITR
jgi:hypothetical protein